MDKDLFILNVQRICKARGEYPTNACVAAGVGKSFISDIKRGQIPSIEKVSRLASYLGVTTSDLLGEKINPDGSKAAGEDMLDKELIDLLCRLDDSDLRRVRDFVSGLKAAREEQPSQQK